MHKKSSITINNTLKATITIKLFEYSCFFYYLHQLKSKRIVDVFKQCI